MSTSKQPTPQRVIQMANEYERLEFQRVLVLEDDKAFAGVLRSFLEGLLYHVTTVSNGVDGLKKVMAQNFDVILCDMMMPNLAGDMFYRAVERVKPDLCKRFIFITAYKADPKVDGFIKTLKTATMLPKPFLMDDLREAIAFVLGQR